jgi:hypothetical protein
MIARLQAQLDAGLQALEGVGNFAYEPRWYWEGGVKVGPCVPASRPFLAAGRDLSDVDHLVTSATSGTPLEPLSIQLESLASQPCFATAASLPSFDSVESLQEFWYQGGCLAFTTALNVATARAYVIPADPRRSVAVLVTEHPKLARLVCKAPGSCPRETRWKDELEADLRLASLQLRLQQLEKDARSRQASERRCALAAATAPKDLQFVHWRDCIERTSRDEALLPRGNLHAVETGWIFLNVQTEKKELSGYLAVNLATGAALRLTSGFGCGWSLRDQSDADLSLCYPGYDPPVRLQLSIQATQRLAWQLLMQAGRSTGRSQTTILQLPSGISATGVVVPSFGICGGSGWTATLGWALADRSGALIATGEDSSWGDSLFAHTQLLYEALLTKAPAPEPLRKGQARWWPKTSQLLRTPWENFADSLLFDVLSQVESW